MKLEGGRLLSTALTILILFYVSLGQTESITGHHPFLVFDATGYSNKPDLSLHGIRSIRLAYTEEFGQDWYKHPNRLPDQQSVRTVATRKAQEKTDVVVLDIEHWPLTGPVEQVGASLAKYMTVLKWFRDAAPGVAIGYYGAPPIRDYERAILDPTNPGRQAWMEENDQIRTLSGAVDVLFPSLYTFSADRTGWKKYAIAQIEEARRSAGGKPVYVFLWPQYHPSNLSLGEDYLAADHWLLELETARTYADGLVIWGGWDLKRNTPLPWDDNAPWWRVTKEFLTNSDRTPPAAPTIIEVF